MRCFLDKIFIPFIVTVIALYYYTPTYAQSLSKITFGINSPLNTNTIYDIHFSADNLLFIATDNGLWSYNGIDFFEYKHSIKYSSEVHCIQENTAGDIFIGDFNGNVFQIKEDSLVLYPVNIKGKVNGFRIIEDYIYYLTSASIYAQSHQDKKIIKIKLPPNTGPYFFSDHGYFYLLGGPNATCLAQIKDTTVSFFNKVESNNLRICSDLKNSSCYIESDKKRYILNTKGDTLIDIKATSKLLTPYKIKEINDQLFLTCKDGLYLPKTNQLFFEGKFVNEVVSDNENNIWVSTLNSGLHKVPNLKNYYYPANPDTEVDLLFVNNDRILHSDKVGNLFYWDLNQQKFIFFYQFRTKGQLKNMVFDSCSNRYIFCGNGRAIFEKNLNQHSFHIRNGGIKLIEGGLFYSQSKLVLWYGHLKNKLPTRKVVTKSKLLYKSPFYSFHKKVDWYSDYFICMAPNKSIKGLVLWKSQVVTNIDNSLYFISIDDYKIKQTIPFSHIQKIFLKNNRLFVITSSKLVEVDYKGDIILEKDRDQGLEYRVVNLSVDDKHISITTKNAVYLLDAHTLEHIHRFTIENGIMSPDFNQAWLYLGDLYVNGYKGISKITLDGNYNKGKVILNLAKVVVNKEESKKTIFEYNQNNVELLFDIRSYSSEGQLKWRINNNAWRENTAGAKRISLNELQPGAYKIEAYFENNFGIVSGRITYTFEIKKPYWQTWWFYGVIYLFALSIILAIVWQRIKDKRKEETLQSQNNLLQIQALQSQMNPHFIFNVQTAIQGLWLRGNEEGALSLQNKFSKLLRKIFQYSGQMSISVEQVIDFNENYIALEQIRFKNEVKVQFEVDPSLLEEDYFIPPLLIQPIIENSFKHGLLHKEENKKLVIKIKNKYPYLYCLVQDNGVGRTKGNTHVFQNNARKSSGLKTTINRLLLLQNSILKEEHTQGNIQITDLKDEQNNPIGTKVELWIPFVAFQEI